MNNRPFESRAKITPFLVFEHCATHLDWLCIKAKLFIANEVAIKMSLDSTAQDFKEWTQSNTGWYGHKEQMCCVSRSEVLILASQLMAKFTLLWSEAKCVCNQAAIVLLAIIKWNLQSLALVSNNIQEKVVKLAEGKFYARLVQCINGN